MNNIERPQLTLGELVSRQALQTPDACALICAGQKMSYIELDRQSDALACHLRKLGVGRDVVVAVCIDRSPEMLISVLGVLKAGGAYLPLDPSYPETRLTFMLNDAGVSILLTQRKHTSRLREHDAQALFVEELDDVLTGLDKPAPDATAALDDLAYVIYTSGSTGQPKGVAMPHRPLVNLVHWQIQQSSSVRTLQFSPLGFDVSFQEIFSTWSAGGELVLIDDDLRLDASRLLAFIENQGIERLFLPFVALQHLAEAAVNDGLYPESLKEIITAGEQLQISSSIAGLMSELPGCTLCNQYGPSETHVVTACTLTGTPDQWPRLPPIGQPIDNTSIYILDNELQPVEDGESGEIFIGGVPLARGYLGRADLTAESFIETTALPGERLYRTGDLGCRNPDGEFEYLGRIDGQVKIRGYRIEPGEIEVVLAGHAGISQVVVKVCEDENTGKRLVAYTVFKNGAEPDATELRQYLGERIPDYMIPSIFMPVDAMPRTPSGKIDRKALPAPGNQRPHLAQACIRPYTDKQKILAECWNYVLELDQIGIHDNFFELGGNSLLALKVVARIRQQTGEEVSVVKLFQYPTISSLEKYLVSGVDAGAELNQLQFRAEQQSKHDSQPDIAIVGMAGRFPGAADIEQLWRNLCDGVESISYFTEETLDNSIDPAVRHNPAYVGARGIMDDADKFDAAFFGITPREAEIMDPQQRVFLEIAWHALENAGYDSERFPGLIGVYAGTGNNSYYHENVWRHPDKIASLGSFLTMVANEKDYVATRVAHKMNLTGPCISIHTGCSTSLVSVCEAFRSLASYQCDIAIAGGVSVTSPINSGYLYQEGGIFSADGHTRSFDSEASGTVFSDGAAAIVLKRLDDALESGDHIHAVIRGVALNNDGAKKVSFTAPSVDGQATVIAMAQANAGVDPDSIGYIEAHGTATPLGDPIEMEALTQAFRYRTDRKQFCAIGSIKSNLGHLTSAAGIAGLIKATLSVENGILPPTLNVETPNPKIDFDNSPFFVNTSLSQWEGGSAAPRRAGVSSFGVGGTNAHIVIEQAPEQPDSGLSRPAQLLLLSAKDAQALDAATDELQAHLVANPEINLADTAFTLQTGRQHFNQRRFVVCSSVPQAVEHLQSSNPNVKLSREQERVDPPVAFMFPGQGAQFIDMGLGLYQHEPVFRDAVDKCARILEPLLGLDLRTVLYPAEDGQEEAAQKIKQTLYTQPALFTIGYALARLWGEWGITAQAMIGHSIGEFVAGCLAQVFSLEDALLLVATRARLMQDCPTGSMLAVHLSKDAVTKDLDNSLSIAAINGPELCVVSGPDEAISNLQSSLEARQINCKTLHTSHAFHSSMMQAAVEPFKEQLRKVKLSAPLLPIVSTVTADWMTDEQAVDPEYWATQLLNPVRFAEGVSTLWREQDYVLLELGPRKTATTMALQQATDKKKQLAIPSLSDSTGDEEWVAVLRALGQLWMSGVMIDWQQFYGAEKRKRLALPGYPFQRKRYWLDNTSIQSNANSMPVTSVQQDAANEEDAMTSEPSLNQPSRKQSLISRLQELLEQSSGIELDGADPALTFFELGLDSLFLTQFATSVQNEFDVKVTFRQLLEDLPAIDQLSDYLDQNLPAEVLMPDSTQVAASVMQASLPNPTGSVSGGGMENLFTQQLQTMSQLINQQMEMLRGNPASALPATQAAVAASSAEAAPTKKPAAAKEKSGKAFGAAARISTVRSNDLTDEQQQHLDALSGRYIERTHKSREFAQNNRKHLADPRVVSGFRPMLKEIIYPIVVEKSSGCRLWDIDGNEYVDFTCGFGSNFFGYQPDFIVDAIKAQLDLGMEIGPQHPLAGKVAGKVCEYIGHQRVAFCNTGSEAVLGAMRLARTVTGRNTIAIFSESYHGIIDEVIVRAGMKLQSMPAAPGIPREAVQNILVLDYGSDASLEILRERGHELAAVMVEPVQSRNPDNQPRDFLHEVREITSKHGAAMIFDEVITGFRIAPGGAQEHFGIKADIATYGKVIGGGMPMGMIAGCKRFMDALDGGDWRFGDNSVPEIGVTYFAGTFVRHPLTMAAANAVIDHLGAAGPQLQQQMNEKAGKMADELNAYFTEHQVPVKICNFGSLFKVKIPQDVAYEELIYHMMRERGVHIWDARPCFLTTAHSDDDIRFIIDAFKESALEMQRCGFFPEPEKKRLEVVGSSFNADEPPVKGARLGKDHNGNPAWFIEDPDNHGKYQQVRSGK